MAEQNTMHIFGTDGSYRRTTKKASWSVAYQGQIKAELVQNFEVIGISPDLTIQYNNCERQSTNNRGELLAILVAMQWIINSDLGQEKKIIVSDSKYCVSTIEEWYDNWVKEDRLVGRLNLDIITIIMDLKKQITNLEFKRIDGHQKEKDYMGGPDEKYCIINDLADKAAQSLTKG